MSEQKELWVKSIYGKNSRQPFVELHYQDTVLQLEPAKAREVARMLFESAEAAEQDAFLNLTYVERRLRNEQRRE